MSLRCGLAGAAAAAVLVAGLGNPRVADAVHEADSAVLAGAVADFADLRYTEGTPNDVIAAIVLRMAVGLVLVALLCALAGRSRSRGAAFIGGWGALTVAAALSAAAAHVYLVAVPGDGQSPAPTYLDGLAADVNAGATFGLWTGWLVGAAVALAVRTDRVRVPARPVPGRGVTSAGGGEPARRRVVDPPPPWWAPTNAGYGVRPGPTVFPPGGLGRPGPAATYDAATYDMATRSGDPHPSDPDATLSIDAPSPGDGGEPEVPAADTESPTAPGGSPPDGTASLRRPTT